MSGVCPRHGEYVQPGEQCRWCEVPAGPESGSYEIDLGTYTFDVPPQGVDMVATPDQQDELARIRAVRDAYWRAKGVKP